MTTTLFTALQTNTKEVIKVFDWSKVNHQNCLVIIPAKQKQVYSQLNFFQKLVALTLCSHKQLQSGND